MFCSHCGTENPSVARFCFKCGNALSENTAQSIVSAQPQASQPTDEGKKFLGGSYHPWRRLFAKTVDISTTGLIVLLIVALGVGILFPSKATAFAKALENQIIAGIILLTLWIPVEAILLSTVGSTPAKWLFGISVRTTDGDILSFQQSLRRSLLVALQGMALGIPFVAFFTQIFAYRRLTKTGSTLWDTAVNSVVAHKTWGAGRAIVCVLSVFVVLVLLGALNAAGKANPQLEQQSSDKPSRVADNAWKNNLDVDSQFISWPQHMQNVGYNGLTSDQQRAEYDHYRNNIIPRFSINKAEAEAYQQEFDSKIRRPGVSPFPTGGTSRNNANDTHANKVTLATPNADIVSASTGCGWQRISEIGNPTHYVDACTVKTLRQFKIVTGMADFSIPFQLTANDLAGSVAMNFAFNCGTGEQAVFSTIAYAGRMGVGGIISTIATDEKDWVWTNTVQVSNGNALLAAACGQRQVLNEVSESTAGGGLASALVGQPNSMGCQRHMDCKGDAFCNDQNRCEFRDQERNFKSSAVAGTMPKKRCEKHIDCRGDAFCNSQNYCETNSLKK